MPDSMADMPGERGALVDAASNYFETAVDARLYETWASTAAAVHGATEYLQYGEVALNDVTSGNLVLFSSGWGDDCYASYFGYTADGNLACLVTDFAV